MTDLLAAPPFRAYADFDTMPIAGERRRGRSERANVDTDPWNGETLTTIQQASVDDLDDAYRFARTAQQSWANALPSERAGVMRRAALIFEARHDEIVGWIVREGGGTLAKAEVEWGIVRDGLHEAASMPHHTDGRIVSSDIPGKESRVYREPAGVVTVISPWNFPMWLSNRSIGPALALGNAVVAKPASDTPVTGGLLLARVYEEAGLPPGVLSVVIGAGGEIGDALVQHPAARVVSFTGSTAVGRNLAATAGVKRLALELGGDCPMVVLRDADLAIAADAAVFGAFFHQGQICMIANRIIVDHSVHDAFVDAFVERVGKLGVGDPADPDTYIGPVINKQQLRTITDKIERARAQGARQLLGGEPTGPTGQTLPPHVLLGDNNVATAREEVFGPVITVIEAHDDDDALAIANDTEYGLSSSVFTADVERGTRFARRVQAGMTHVNDSPLNDEPNVAFGGEKASGIGRFGGRWAVDEFTTEHWISVQHEPRLYPS
jgi:aldehyde dehydrogenase (NAD+)